MRAGSSNTAPPYAARPEAGAELWSLRTGLDLADVILTSDDGRTADAEARLDRAGQAARSAGSVAVANRVDRIRAGDAPRTG